MVIFSLFFSGYCGKSQNQRKCLQLFTLAVHFFLYCHGYYSHASWIKTNIVIEVIVFFSVDKVTSKYHRWQTYRSRTPLVGKTDLCFVLITLGSCTTFLERPRLRRVFVRQKIACSFFNDLLSCSILVSILTKLHCWFVYSFYRMSLIRLCTVAYGNNVCANLISLKSTSASRTD